MGNVVGLDGGVAGETRKNAALRPDEDVADVLVAMIDQRRDRPTVEIVEPAALERKPVGGEIAHRRREIEAAVEPGCDGVLGGRDHVFEMAGVEGPGMPGE